MTLDKKKENEWEEFLRTGRGGIPAIKGRKTPPKNINVSSKQQAALRRGITHG